MENALPTYEMATSQDHWSIIAPYIQSPDLCSCALVCERWHEIFAPKLWGNPASHFGTEDDSVYVALTRFRRTLTWARLYVRQMTHTLHMPPAHAELYEGPHSDWLRDILERLPNLQSLIVDGLPFFDHSSLLTLRYFGSAKRPPNPRALPIYPLRFLDAKGCVNATSGGLAEALSHFPFLFYLDLSRTVAAKVSDVLKVIASLRGLQILKLTDLALKDDDVALFTQRLGAKLRSLDVRNNMLTDRTARTLLNDCFRKSSREINGPEAGSFTESGTVLSLTMRSASPMRDETLPHHQDNGLDGYVRRRLTRELVGHLALEDSSPSGMTHLYIANNKFTAEGVSGLLRPGRLNVLDCGDVDRALPDNFPSPVSPEAEAAKATMQLPGVAKLLPVLAGLGSRELTYLRVNHEIVTDELPVPPAFSEGPVELPSDSRQGIEPPLMSAELEGSRPRAELDSIDNETAHPELEDTGTERFELPGDSVFFHVTPAHEHSYAADYQSMTTSSVSSGNFSRGHTISSISSTNPTNHRPFSFALSEPDGDDDDEPSLVLNANGTGLTPAAAALGGISAPHGNTTTSTTTLTPHPNHRTYSSIISERRARASYNRSHPHFLTPSMISKTSTLVLTSLPQTTTTFDPIKRITDFLTACGEEASLAHLQAQLGYAMPPGQRGLKSAQREYARSIFALQTLVLELAPKEVEGRKVKASWRKYPTKSSTEDADSEAFWDAAQYDFSFFGDEECGVPAQQQLGLGGTMFGAVSDKIVVGDCAESRPGRDGLALGRTQRHEPQETPSYDVVAELSRFRREAKAKYEAALAAGEVNPQVQGYWEGEIRIVRPPGGM